MKKILLYVISVLFIVITVAFIIWIVIVPKIKIEYNRSDCITYFDEKAQYQLVKFGGMYYFYDAKLKKTVSAPINYYYAEDNHFYAICENGDYFVYNTKTDEKRVVSDINDLSRNIKCVFEKEEFIDLTIKRNTWVKWVNKFLPNKIRKW